MGEVVIKNGRGHCLTSVREPGVKMNNRVVMFDTNAIRNFFRPRAFNLNNLEELRGRVLKLVAANDLRVVITQPVLWELTAIISDCAFGGFDRYDEAIRYYAAIGSQHFMAHEFQRMRIELRSRRPVAQDDLFHRVNVAELSATCLSQHWIRSKTAEVAEIKRRERAREEKARLWGVEGFAKLAKDRGCADWKAMLDADLSPAVWETTVARMVKASMRSRARREKLRIAGHRWPLPKQAPTFWARECFLLAKARYVFVESKKELTSKNSLQDVPDNLDACHFRDAAYVDILVTDDAAFSSVAKGAQTKLQVLSQKDFAAEIGVHQ